MTITVLTGYLQVGHDGNSPVYDQNQELPEYLFTGLLFADLEAATERWSIEHQNPPHWQPTIAAGRVHAWLATWRQDNYWETWLMVPTQVREKGQK